MRDSNTDNLLDMLNTKTDNTEKVLKKLKTTKKVKSSVKPRGIEKKIAYAREMSEKIFKDNLKYLELATNEDYIKEYIDRAIKNGVLAVDTETNGLDRIDGKIAGVCLYTPGKKGMYIPIGHVDYSTGKLLNSNVSKQFIKGQFERMNKHKVKYILHNAKFDMHILYWMLDVKIIPYWDTLLASNLLNENEPHNLKVLYHKYIADESEEVGKFADLFNGIEFNKLPLDVAYMYAGYDPIMTYELYKYQEPYLTKENKKCCGKGLEKVADVFHNIEMPLINVVFKMEVQGVDINIDLAKELYTKYKTYEENALNSFNKRIADMERAGKFDSLQVTSPANYSKIYDTKNNKISVNISSPKQLGILLYDVMGLVSPDSTKPRGTGEPILAQYNNPIVGDILEYRAMSKLISTYIEAIPDHISKRDNKLHANFNQYGAKTGRFSSSDPNLQNIPSKKKTLADGTVIDAGHDIRQMFIAGEGQVIVGGDFSQQEPRCLAHMSGDEHMIQAYKDGKDLYSTIASKIYKMPYEECKEFRADGTVNPDGKARRSSVKPVLLGIMYGRGVNSIAEVMKIDVDRAQGIIDDFYKEFPKVKDFVTFAQSMARDYGYVATAWGRKRRLPDMQLDIIDVYDMNGNDVNDTIYYKYLKRYLRAYGRKNKEKIIACAKIDGYIIKDNNMKIKNAERQCVNSIIQGSSADMTKLTMIAIDKDPILNKLNYKLIIPVHDEVLGVCPVENAKAVKERLEHIMVHIVDGIFDIPMKCDIEITKAWYGEEVEI